MHRAPTATAARATRAGQATPSATGTHTQAQTAPQPQEGQMTPQTSTPAPTAATELETLRQAKIAAYAGHQADLEAAQARKDQAAIWSHGAKKANRVREIAELELDQTLAGETFTPWERPRAAKTKNTESQESLQAKADTLTALIAKPGVDDRVKHTAEQRLNAITKAAKRAGYTLS